MQAQVSYTVRTSQDSWRAQFDTPQEAAKAFFNLPPADQPILIRVERDAAGRESASIPGQTHHLEKGGIRTYWKDLGGFDAPLNEAYAALQQVAA